MTLYDDRLELAQRIAGHVVERYGDNVRAIGLEGSMAHGSAAVDHRSDIDIVVVAREPKAIPEREIFLGDVLISMGVTSEADLLDEAGEIRWDWAYASDGFENFKPLHDPDGLFPSIRERHRHALASTSDRDLTERARGLLMGAMEYVGKGERSVEQGSRAAASVCLVEALITIALCVGMYTRTRWRGSHSAVGATAQAGEAIDGFAEPYTEATEDALDIPRRLAAARRACDALRARFEGLGARSVVLTVEELFD